MRQGTPHTPRVFEVTSLNHNKVQRQGAPFSPEAASVTTKDGRGVHACLGSGDAVTRRLLTTLQLPL